MMRRYRYINPDTELEIRRGFSGKLSEMLALKKWLADTFGQMVLHDPLLDRYTARVKTIESVLRKIDAKVADERERLLTGTLTKEKAVWNAAETFDDFLRLIDDWVGCRVVSYVSSELPRLHMELLAHARLGIHVVTLHDSAEQRQFPHFPIREGIDELRLNHNGYVGIHYIVTPSAIDPCWRKPPTIFGKFELQVRSLIQETWSQVQHAVIYKGPMPEALKGQRASGFADLSEILSSCDNVLSRLAADPVAAVAIRGQKPRKKATWFAKKLADS